MLILLQLPVVGPLLFLPAAAAAAYLADLLDRLPSTQKFKAGVVDVVPDKTVHAE